MFKSGAKGLTSGSERIPVGFGKVRLRSGLAALVGWLVAEETIVGDATLFTLMEQRCGYGLIPSHFRRSFNHNTGFKNEYYTHWHTAIGQRTSCVVHRNCPNLSAVPARGSGTRGRRQRYV